MLTIKTSFGEMEAELFEKDAPETVKNFLRYVEEEFFDGTIFHRVIPGFMVQGGGFTESFEQKATHEPIENEAANGLSNKVGTLAMARTSDPHSATCQFFINTVDNKFLDFTAANARGYGYCVFGKVTSGLDVLKKIEKVKTSSRGYYDDVPVENVVIESIRRK